MFWSNELVRLFNVDIVYNSPTSQALQSQMSLVRPKKQRQLVLVQRTYMIVLCRYCLQWSNEYEGWICNNKYHLWDQINKSSS